MEGLVPLFGMLFMIVAFCAGFLLLVVQPIWTIVDVACSPKLSGGAKAALIVLTIVVLGPLLTFFYALFGTESGALRKTTILSGVALLLSVGCVLGLAALEPPMDGGDAYGADDAGSRSALIIEAD